ncbi:hypothetical protein [Chitinophaga japonensis]|uniref:Uncharacterized protein n=1 Tax=Chitinophaga japonensis TaxID=104662 RepID=A0A562T2J9_CHIJA|nr:hypothetical protein [Chitinophaga japonensis]TWI87875.1 hypothetical protein LX66_1949 [Chitinophaga japonensis]
MSKPVSPPVFKELHTRVHELPENFKDFVQSECKWTANWYACYLQCPEQCSREDIMTMLKIATDLAQDLLALTTRCKKALSIPKSHSHETE